MFEPYVDSLRISEPQISVQVCCVGDSRTRTGAAAVNMMFLNGEPLSVRAREHTVLQNDLHFMIQHSWITQNLRKTGRNPQRLFH